MPGLSSQVHPYYYGPRSYWRTSSFSQTRYQIKASGQVDSQTRFVIGETGVQVDHSTRFKIREEDSFTN